MTSLPAIHCKIGTGPGTYLKIRQRRLWPLEGEVFWAKEEPIQPGVKWAEFRVIEVDRDRDGVPVFWRVQRGRA